VLTLSDDTLVANQLLRAYDKKGSMEVNSDEKKPKIVKNGIKMRKMGPAKH